MALLSVAVLESPRKGAPIESRLHGVGRVGRGLRRGVRRSRRGEGGERPEQ